MAGQRARRAPRAARAAVLTTVCGGVLTAWGPAPSAVCVENEEGMVITGGEVSPARDRVQRVSGVCAGRPMGVDLIGLPIREVVVRGGHGTRRYKASEPFVRELAQHVALTSVALECPSSTRGLSVTVYSTVPGFCTYRVSRTLLKFGPKGFLLQRWPSVVEEPDHVRAYLRHHLTTEANRGRPR